jgi:hypothetical protein
MLKHLLSVMLIFSKLFSHLDESDKKRRVKYLILMKLLDILNKKYNIDLPTFLGLAVYLLEKDKSNFVCTVEDGKVVLWHKENKMKFKIDRDIWQQVHVELLELLERIE